MNISNLRRVVQVFVRAVFLLAISQTVVMTVAATEAPLLRFSYIQTGTSAGAQEAMVVASGSWFTRRTLSHGAILVEHPAGSFLFDTGLGQSIDGQFQENPWWAKQLFAYKNVVPARAQMAAQGYDVRRLMAIVPSHLHWDHASGIVDFPGVPVWIQPQELAAARLGGPPSFLAAQIGNLEIRWKEYTLIDPPFLGFDRSLDVFGDRSVVLVDLSGHTAGQVGLYLELPAGERYLFVGDATWTVKGVRDNSPRPVFVSWLVDVEHDKAASDAVITQLSALMKKDPALVIVPAHDELIAAKLPLFPQFSDE